MVPIKLFRKDKYNIQDLFKITQEVMANYNNWRGICIYPETSGIVRQLYLLNEFKLGSESYGITGYKLDFEAPNFPLKWRLEFDKNIQLLHVLIAKSGFAWTPTIQEFRTLKLICTLAEELCLQEIYPSEEQIRRVQELVRADRNAKLVDVLKIFYENYWEKFLRKLARDLTFTHVAHKLELEKHKPEQ
jgi:hypothetical protein